MTLLGAFLLGVACTLVIEIVLFFVGTIIFVYWGLDHWAGF